MSIKTKVKKPKPATRQNLKIEIEKTLKRQKKLKRLQKFTPFTLRAFGCFSETIKGKTVEKFDTFSAS